MEARREGATLAFMFLNSYQVRLIGPCVPILAAVAALQHHQWWLGAPLAAVGLVWLVIAVRWKEQSSKNAHPKDLDGID